MINNEVECNQLQSSPQNHKIKSNDMSIFNSMSLQMPKLSENSGLSGPGQPKKCTYEAALVRAIIADITQIARERKFDDGEIERALLSYKNEGGSPRESGIGKGWYRYGKGRLRRSDLLTWVVANALLPASKQSYKEPEKKDGRAWLPQYWQSVFNPQWYWIRFQDEEVISVRYVDENGNPATEMRSQVERKADFDRLANRLENADRLEDQVPRKWLEDFTRDVTDKCREIFSPWEYRHLDECGSEMPLTPFLSKFLESWCEKHRSNEFFIMEASQKAALDHSVSLVVKAVEGSAKKFINCLDEALRDIDCFELLVPQEAAEVWQDSYAPDGLSEWPDDYFVKCRAKKNQLDEKSVYLLSAALKVHAKQLGLSIGYGELLASLAPKN